MRKKDNNNKCKKIHHPSLDPAHPIDPCRFIQFNNHGINSQGGVSTWPPGCSQHYQGGAVSFVKHTCCSVAFYPFSWVFLNTNYKYKCNHFLCSYLLVCCTCNVACFRVSSFYLVFKYYSFVFIDFIWYNNPYTTQTPNCHTFSSFFPLSAPCTFFLHQKQRKTPFALFLILFYIIIKYPIFIRPL